MIPLFTDLKPKIHYTAFILLGLTYAVFQTRNAMIDSWYYAACVKYGQELFNSHHLLYNFVGFYWFSLLKWVKPSVEAIVALNLMNAISATSCLLVLYGCLLRLKNTPDTSFQLTLFCAACFGFMRYATDAETYILPILFSLISTYFFLNPGQKSRLFLSGLFSAIAILIHQLHVWWSLAMLVSLFLEKPIRLNRVLMFVLPFILVPAIYYVAFLHSGSQAMSFTGFITGEYSKGNASIDISVTSFLLTIVNFIRTFIQVHGQVIFLFKQYLPVCLILIIFCLGSVVYGISKKGFKMKVVKTISGNGYPFLFPLAFIMHLLFAFISTGNAEFMVMLPFLIVLFLGSKYRFEDTGILKYLTLSLFVWNFGISILPNALLDIHKVDHQVQTTMKNPAACFIWKNKPLVENRISYLSGFRHSACFLKLKTLSGNDIDSLLSAGRAIYTDLPNKGSGYNRETYLSDDEANPTLGRYRLIPVDTFQNLYGINYIYRFSPLSPGESFP